MASLAYNANTNVYKAVHIYSFGFGFEILTLGASCDTNNQWRRVPAPIKESSELPSYDWEELDREDPVEINNHISHWNVKSGEYFISMDANEERSRKTYHPQCADIMYRKKCSYCNLGGYFGLLYEVSSRQLDIWILEDYERQVWFKKHSIVSGAIQFRVLSGGKNICESGLPKWDNLFTVGSIRNGEVIIFATRSDCVYILDTKLMELRKSKKKLKPVLAFVSHKKSFESLNSLLQPTMASA